MLNAQGLQQMADNLRDGLRSLQQTENEMEEALERQRVMRLRQEGAVMIIDQLLEGERQAANEQRNGAPEGGEGGSASLS